MHDANPIAYLMLCLWPVISWILFTKLDPARALIWTILGGYMLLPPAIAMDLPVLPDMNKYVLANLGALTAVLFLLKQRLELFPVPVVAQILIGVYILSPFATVLTNGDAMWFEASMLPAMRLYDSLAVVGNQFIGLIPFFLGRQFLARGDGMRKIVGALVLAGLIYSVPMLLEARISPQLNLWIYGYFQHDFSQTIRFDGYRPFVFMQHGLWVAFFALMCFVSSVALLRVGPAAARPRYLLGALYLLLVLVLCRSAGPIIYAMLLAPLVLFAPQRLQLVVAGGVAAVVISYPLLRGLHLIPVDELMRFATGMNAERGASLQFRLFNEELLLNKAAERPWFGWGNYGRGLLHDPGTGEINVIADGGWIIVLGTFGWFGYLGMFGLLTLPVMLLAREALRRNAMETSPFAVVVALILAVNLFDLLPNDTLIPFTWLMAGAVMGHAEALRAAWVAGQRDLLRPGRTVL